MERRYTIETLPSPNDARIRIRERPARVMAVRGYSGRWSDDNDGAQREALLAALERDGIRTRGEPVVARHDSPFTPWFLRRNEVMIAVDWPRPSQ